MHAKGQLYNMNKAFLCVKYLCCDLKSPAVKRRMGLRLVCIIVVLAALPSCIAGERVVHSTAKFCSASPPVAA